MSEATLKEMVRQIMQQAGSYVSFAWQGGEPTLMGLPFFEKAVAFQQMYGRNQSVGNGLQTNGTLIDDNWAAFFKKYNFLVGLSLDGPEHIHDKYRLLKGGQGSWSKVQDTARRLINSGVEVNALTVLNSYSAQFPEEIYTYHKSLNLTFMQFIPCLEAENDDKSTPAPYSVTPEQYGSFLTKLFDLWLADFDGIRATSSIRFFDSVFHSYVGLAAPQCTLAHECGVYVVIEHNGDVYSCDFYVEPNWKLGNIKENKIVEMLNSEKQTGFGKIKSVLPTECRTCQWRIRCRGGCPKDRTISRPDSELNYFCESYKMFFSHADAKLRTLAQAWKKEQATQKK